MGVVTLLPATYSTGPVPDVGVLSREGELLNLRTGVVTLALRLEGAGVDTCMGDCVDAQRRSVREIPPLVLVEGVSLVTFEL